MTRQPYPEIHTNLTLLQDEKACFSKVSYDSDHDFSVSFQDSQNLQLLRQKLLRTSTVLDSCLEVVKGCEIHCRRLIASGMTAGGEQSLAELEVYKMQMQGHRLDLHRILQYSLGTSKLVRFCPPATLLYGKSDDQWLTEVPHGLIAVHNPGFP
jgi:hypothetical protein